MEKIETAAVFILYPKKEFGIKVDMPQQYICFVLENTSMAVANSLRRVCEAELPTKRLKMLSCKTNDVFMIQPYMAIMIKAISINQNVSMDKEFILEKRITSADDQDILTTDIKNNTGVIPLGHPIVRLGGINKNRPNLTKGNEEVYIQAKLGIVENIGYLDGKHSQCCAGSAVIQPIDKKPFAYGGEQSTNCLPTKYYIKMISRGGLSAAELLNNAIDNIKTRLRSLEQTTKNIILSKEVENLHILMVPNETPTIGELMMTEVLENDPNCEWFTYKEVKDGIEFRSSDADMKETINNSVKTLITKYDHIQKEFAKNKELHNPINVYGEKELSAKLLETFGHLPYLNNGKKGYIHL